MKHSIISMEIGVVEPLISPKDGNNPATGQPWPALEQQIGNILYKNGSVGRKFLVVKSMPEIDMNNLSIIGLGKVDTEVTFLADAQIAVFEQIIANAKASTGGFMTANGGKPFPVTKEYFDVPVPPFYWVDDNGARRKDANGDLFPIISTVRVMSSIQDGKPAKDINAEALRMVRQFGRFATDTDLGGQDPYTPPVSADAAAAAALAAAQGQQQPVVANAGVAAPNIVPPVGP